MQVSSVAQPLSPPPASGGGVVAVVLRQSAILADGSGASDDQKIDAYVAIGKALYTSSVLGFD